MNMGHHQNHLHEGNQILELEEDQFLETAAFAPEHGNSIELR